MRTLTDHTVAPGSDALNIKVIDKPGPGGAHHLYSIFSPPDWHGVAVPFQKGPVREHGVNGLTDEALLVILIDRLACFQAGDFACSNRRTALLHLRDALENLNQRTHDRVARGVEGTSAP